MARFWALWLLGTALLKTLVTWPLRKSRALRAFRNNYGPEGLLPVPLRVHRALLAVGGCTGCGRCDRVTRQGGLVPLSQLVRAWTRSLPDAALTTAEFARYGDAALVEAERLCPFGVPIRTLAELMRDQAASMPEAPVPQALPARLSALDANGAGH